MEQVIDTILNRRSIRNYKKKQIEDKDLKTILECGSYAPSGMNMQSYKLIAIQNDELMQELANGCKKIRDTDINPLYDAPTIILAFGDSNIPTYINDVSCAIQNMHLATTSLGLGACWINCVKDFVDNTEDGKLFRNKIDIEDNYKCVGSLVLGYIEGEYPEAKPRKTDIIKIIK